MGNVRLPNMTLLEVTSEPQQIDCNSPGDLPVGQWYYPSGGAIPEGSSPPVYAVYRAVAKRAELKVQSSLYEEGIYACVIKANGVIHSTSFLGLYNSISAGECRIVLIDCGLLSVSSTKHNAKTNLKNWLLL